VLSDDEITDRIASEVAARVQADHPDADAERRRRLVRAYTRRAVGENLTLDDLGAILGQAPQRVHELESRALARAYHTYRQLFPDLL
jgi:DNA-directed RNA polymerase sigma subunit (sigma70/sigma32)